jgi:hypothetical protein
MDFCVRADNGLLRIDVRSMKASTCWQSVMTEVKEAHTRDLTSVGDLTLSFSKVEGGNSDTMQIC